MISLRPSALVSVLALVFSPAMFACSSAPNEEPAAADEAQAASSASRVEFDVTIGGAPSKLWMNANDYFALVATSEEGGDVSTASTAFALGGELHINTPRGNQHNWCSNEAKARCSSGGRLDIACACREIEGICSGKDLTTAQKALGCRRSRASANRITVEVPSRQARSGADVIWQGVTYAIVTVGACFASGVCEVVLAPIGL